MIKKNLENDYKNSIGKIEYRYVVNKASQRPILVDKTIQTDPVKSPPPNFSDNMKVNEKSKTLHPASNLNKNSDIFRPRQNPNPNAPMLNPSNQYKDNFVKMMKKSQDGIGKVGDVMGVGDNHQTPSKGLGIVNGIRESGQKVSKKIGLSGEKRR